MHVACLSCPYKLQNLMIMYQSVSFLFPVIKSRKNLNFINVQVVLWWHLLSEHKIFAINTQPVPSSST